MGQDERQRERKGEEEREEVTVVQHALVDFPSALGLGGIPAAMCHSVSQENSSKLHGIDPSKLTVNTNASVCKQHFTAATGQGRASLLVVESRGPTLGSGPSSSGSQNESEGS